MLSFLNPLPSLSAYRGPHRVGSAEFEIPVSEISSEISPPNPEVTTIKFRLYYPTTKDAKSKKSVYWLPEPQNEWNAAYASFMGVSPRSTSIFSRVLGLWNYTTLPLVNEAPLPAAPSQLPVCFFSHGLGGNSTTYSSVVGNLASCGLLCVVPEHRDGSSPISFIKNADGRTARTIPYQKHSHSPTTEVLNARNAQLRVRLWELELTYSVIKAMNEGKSFTNYADSEMDQSQIKERLDLTPGRVAWTGHSFGACTITQFVKSVYYRERLPKQTSSSEGWDMRPILSVTQNSAVASQITSSSPVALLDLWTMPLRSETTKWLWELPLPSHDRDHPSAVSTVAVISAEFYKWKELLNRTRAVLSKDPVTALGSLEDPNKTTTQVPHIPDDSTTSENPIPELNKQENSETLSVPPNETTHSTESSRTPSPARTDSAKISANSSKTSLVPSEGEQSLTTSVSEPRLYLVPQSAHLSQSDFGILFPNLTKYAMKAIEPQKTIEMNVDAMLAVVQNAGNEVEPFVGGKPHALRDDLTEKERWVRVPLI